MQTHAKTMFRRAALAALAGTTLTVGAVSAVGCAATSHPSVPADLGAPSRSASLDAVVDEPGPLTVETVIGADWAVPRSGLLNLDHPEAKAAKLTDGDEPIHVAFHVVRHPIRGTFLVDTGVERALFEQPDEAVIRGIAARVARADTMKRRTDTKTWVEQSGAPIAGVFVTHLHMDHIAGMRDVPAGTPVFVGPGESTARSVENLFVASIVDRALENKPPLSVLGFERDPDGAFEGVLDVFGDGSFWALHVPGHTPGSTAFVARTPSGPVLLTGDACHTAWGWEHGVEPGSFSHDKAASAASLARLRTFAAKHPTIDVRLGHQSLTRSGPS
ncbi:MAG: MBL fold metallo-hydrolase [Labilithrix sp.]|nr:MBL fold metallo-hydrolase [Labilithrix sp.]